MERVIVSIPYTECPHCHKIIGIAILRIGAKIKGSLLSDANELECPRAECGKLIGYATLASVK